MGTRHSLSVPICRCMHVPVVDEHGDCDEGEGSHRHGDTGGTIRSGLKNALSDVNVFLPPLWSHTRHPVPAMLLVLLHAAGAPTPSLSKARRDVIMMVADDMRPDTACTSVMGTTSGDMHTPNICALADESLLLTRFHVAFAECAPSRASMLTSRQPHTTRVWNLHSYWRQEGGNFTTLPQYFKEHGYITKGIGKIFHWGAASGKPPLTASGLSAVYFPDNASRSLFRGEFDSDYSWTEEYFAPDGIHDDMDDDAMQPIPEQGPDGTKAKPLADELSVAHAAETLQQIQKARSEGTDSRAFFLAVGWIRPHLPYRFPERFLQYYDADKLELPNESPGSI